jgi:hypothetical protein
MADTKKKAEAFLSGAMNILNSSKSLTPSRQPPSFVDSKPLAAVATMENNPEDIPKEELLHLMMKMNSRMAVSFCCYFLHLTLLTLFAFSSFFLPHD